MIDFKDKKLGKYPNIYLFSCKRLLSQYSLFLEHSATDEIKLQKKIANVVPFFFKYILAKLLASS